MKKLSILFGPLLVLSGCSFMAVQGDDSATPEATITATSSAKPTESAGPSESELKQLLAEDLAGSILFTFDNFQCWDGDDCKAIYELRYYGPKNRHQVKELFSSEVSGFISSPSGDRAAVGVIALQDASGLAYGYLKPDVTYRAIINTSSEINVEYDSIFLESHGVVILDDYFGCFRSEARIASTTPTC